MAQSYPGRSRSVYSGPAPAPPQSTGEWQGWSPQPPARRQTSLIHAAGTAGLWQSPGWWGGTAISPTPALALKPQTLPKASQRPPVLSAAVDWSVRTWAGHHLAPKERCSELLSRILTGLWAGGLAGMWAADSGAESQPLLTRPLWHLDARLRLKQGWVTANSKPEGFLWEMCAGNCS